MTNEKILEMLQEVECELFHKWADDPKNEELKKAHLSARKALEDFFLVVGDNK